MQAFALHIIGAYMVIWARAKICSIEYHFKYATIFRITYICHVKCPKNFSDKRNNGLILKRSRSWSTYLVGFLWSFVQDVLTYVFTRFLLFLMNRYLNLKGGCEHWPLLKTCLISVSRPSAKTLFMLQAFRHLSF